MSSFLCFICHSTVNEDTNEDMREKYREVVGMNLCPDSHLCHICCHVLNRLWLFRSVCLKRSLEYPVLFSEKGTLNLQRNDLEIHTVCFEDCEHYKNRNVNSKYYHFKFFDDTSDSNEEYPSYPNEYVKFDNDRIDFEEFQEKPNYQEVIHNNDKEEYIRNFNDTDEKSNNGYAIEQNFDDNDDNTYRDTQDRNFDNNDENPYKNCENYEENNDNPYNNSQTHEEIHENSFKDNHEKEVIVKDPETDEQLNKEEESTEKEVNCEKIDEPPSPNLHTDVIEKELEITEVKKKEKKKSKSKKEQPPYEKLKLSVSEQKAELERNRKEKKYIEAEFKCYNCAMGFLFKDTYQAHMMRHEESNGEYRCNICTLRFATPAVLRAHTSLHAERHKCTNCGEVVRPRHRASHTRECRQLPTEGVACHQCGRMFNGPNALQQHLKRFHRSKSTGRTYACSVCGERYHDQAAVRTHMLKHIQRKFHCDTCSSTFSSPYTLRQHQKKHESPKIPRAKKPPRPLQEMASFECPMCGRACPSQRSLESHVATVHSARKDFACPACPARYTTRKSLVRHTRQHEQREEKPKAVCHHCGASFKSNKLNRHLRQVCEKDKWEEELSSYC